MALENSTLAGILGISRTNVDRLVDGQYLLDHRTKEWELAQLLVRLFINLDSIVAGDEHALRHWLTHEHRDLRGIPVNLITDISGLVHTVDYLDSYRAKV